MTPLSVAVIQGGPSTEAEVSRASAKGIAAGLTDAGHRVTRLELDARLGEALLAGSFDVVFPITHGEVGEDGSLQGLLEVLDLPYVGSGVLASAMAMDKRVAKILFATHSLPIAPGIAVRRGDAFKTAERVRDEVGDRVVIKPATHGSAIGVSRIEASRPLSEVAAALDRVWAIDEVAICEHFAMGTEVTCGVLEITGEPVALPTTEIVSPNDPFYTYEARYAAGRSVHHCPARLPTGVTSEVQRVAVGAFVALGCRDLARVDFIVGDNADHNRVTLLEVNTLPGFTATSLLPEAAGVAHIPMLELCDRLVRRAFDRGPSPRKQALPLPK